MQDMQVHNANEGNTRDGYMPREQMGRPLTVTEQPHLLVFPGYDNAIEGIGQRDNELPIVIYSYTKLLWTLVERDGMTKEEAAEFIDYNMTGWMGPQTPIILMVGGKEQ